MEQLFSKYRPQTWEDVLGNDDAIESIKSQLEHGERVFLFTGEGGCGKTTCARILAKHVGAGDLSIIESNSSDERGIAQIREIGNQTRYVPNDGEATVVILDECHKLTNDAQNALLKITEEPPEYCYFILCTTDPQKLIAPLKTRCSKVNFKPLDTNTMCRLLRRVSRREMQKVSDDVFLKIAELANGSSRDGLKILASVLYLESDEKRMNYLNTNGSGVSEDAIVLPRTLMKATDWSQIAKALIDVKADVSSNAEGVRQLCMSYAHSCLLKEYNPRAEAMIQCFSNQDTYRNGVYAITVACLDFLNMISG